MRQTPSAQFPTSGWLEEFDAGFIEENVQILR
jgi:hypothetical protein